MRISTESGDRMCDRCGLRKARIYPLAILGSLTLSERALCEECDALETVAAESAGPSPEGDFRHLGPIEFGTLLELLDQGTDEPRDVLAWYAARIREIAQAHAQAIPAAVESHLKRFEGP